MKQKILNKITKKKILLSIIAILLAICIIGVSYALWSTRASQLSSNSINSDCLELEFTDKNNISLLNTYPLTDSEAEKLTPYTFVVKNKCNSSVYYKVDLEIMDDKNKLSSEYIAVDINNIGKKLLSSYTSVEPTYKDDNYKAIESRELIEYGILEGGKTATYNLKLWMDESVTIEDDAMNKIFASKISVVASKGDYNPVLAKAIVNLAITDTTNLVYDDGTNDHNTRYIGSNPNNYLCFDRNCTNGKWRVIGVMNNIETEKRGTQSLVKIIRADSIGDIAWNSANTNDWTTATLQINLNSGDWWTKNLSDYDDLLETVTWNLGGSNAESLSTSSFYNIERGATVYSGRKAKWSGKIALMYPSDYGYATSGGSTTDRETCLTKILYNWDNTSVSDCKNNDYLNLNSFEYTLTPNSNYSHAVYLIRYGTVSSYQGYYYAAYYGHPIRPVGFLKSNIEILSGDGTGETPWVVGLE